MKIGFFDSGIGGTTVLRQVRRDLPQYDYLYYADNAHMPYGEKSPSELYELTTAALTQMFAKGCALIILACNTATTVLPRIQQEWLPERFPDRKVLGVIRPTVEHMMTIRAKRIYLLATEATVTADSYGHELTKLASDIDLIQVPCPYLASEIENASDPSASSLVRHLLGQYLRDIPPNTTLYTGCTHYELVRDMIYEISGIKAYTQGYLAGKSLIRYLSDHPQITGTLSTYGTLHIYNSKLVNDFGSSLLRDSDFCEK